MQSTHVGSIYTPGDIWRKAELNGLRFFAWLPRAYSYQEILPFEVASLVLQAQLIR
jgi:hypothetical protein